MFVLTKQKKIMKCPVCYVPLKRSQRKQVDIDYCPRCRGIWLDRGELDKIIQQTVEHFAGEADTSAGRQGQRQQVYPDPGEMRRHTFFDEYFDFD